tara:strand:+ start:1144 stop:2442 length:1299 start_codon:yes stop_codon:yes gene_type:complete
MAKPKLALIPAAQGTRLYSVLPSDGTGDFDFTRGSTTNPDATRVNAQGLIESVPNTSSRLNYPLIDGKVVGCPHHLLEPQRTNLLPYSEDFSQWTASDLTVTDNNAISPDGTLNASKLTAISGNNTKRIQEAGFSTTSTDRCFSIFVKTDDIKAIQLLHSGDLQGFARFDLVDYTVGSVGSKTTATIENYGNGWYKCTAIFDSTNAFGSSLYVYISDSAIGIYGGTSSEVGDLLIYGAQYEESSYPTSYIKSNIGSPTTRLADTASGSGNAATFNDSEGVLMAEISALDNDSTSRQISLSSGSSATNKVSLNYTSTSNQVQAFIRSGGSIAFNVSEIVSDTTNNNKIALKYKQNDFALWVNGIELATNTIDGNTPTGLNVLDFDDADGTSNFYGKAKQVQYFDSALTDTQLEELTSWDSFSDMANGQLYTIE